jgi:hypothetical protein
MSTARRPSSGGRGFPVAVVVALLVAVPLMVLSVRLGLQWRASGARLAALEREAASVVARAAVLDRAAQALRTHDFQVCNRSADTLSLPWVAAVHHDGQSLRVFDSASCQGFRSPLILAGESRALVFSSTQEGCNWNGEVLFYAMNAVRESDTGSASYNLIGAWGRDFDPKCFNVR